MGLFEIISLLHTDILLNHRPNLIFVNDSFNVVWLKNPGKRFCSSFKKEGSYVKGQKGVKIR